ncbi:hypothetical protein EJ08DRAFT_682760 [Tothia fuscella]|uniref:NADP-dependent oxidoreductase domain-containing protein n=1 Tax=Tothia fuscella TaxID=1048955 RepID=A0A9P4NIF3_9PEZI|nr:hypothetical protein EJ08DRAFT_682760 [Tothia fuscella]
MRDPAKSETRHGYVMSKYQNGSVIAFREISQSIEIDRNLMSSAIFFLLVGLAIAQGTLPATPPKGTALTDIPILGLGTWQISTNTAEAVSDAIVQGYRHIDAAYIYGNQGGVGQGITDGLRKTGLKREDLWITGKLWSTRHGQEEYGLKETLNQLGLEYLDLFLIHWPVGNSTTRTTYDYIQTWKGMEKLVKPTGGGTRYIGLANFSPSQVDDIMKIATIKPKVHQFELHPYLQQSSFILTNHAHNISITAYSPLGNTNPVYSGSQGGSRQPKILSHTTITSIAKERGCTPAQVVLAWNMARGVSVIPKAAKAEHRKENIETVTKCKLEGGDVEKIGKLDAKLRLSILCGTGDLRAECFRGLDASP